MGFPGLGNVGMPGGNSGSGSGTPGPGMGWSGSRIGGIPGSGSIGGLGAGIGIGHLHGSRTTVADG